MNVTEEMVCKQERKYRAQGEAARGGHAQVSMERTALPRYMPRVPSISVPSEFAHQQAPVEAWHCTGMKSPCSSHCGMKAPGMTRVEASCAAHAPLLAPVSAPGDQSSQRGLAKSRHLAQDKGTRIWGLKHRAAFAVL